MNNKYLIINADDFGIQKQTNTAINELFEKGLITSASLMAVAPFASEACASSKINNLPVGIHLTLNSDDPISRWQSITKAKSLNDDKGMYNDSKKLTFKAKSLDVSNEIEAQYQHMVKNGCTPDHADSHSGTLYGINGRFFFMNAFRFCNEHNLPFRFPKRPDFLVRQLGEKMPKILFKIHKLIVSRAKKYNVKLIDDMISNPYSIKKIKRYDDLKDYYINEIKNIKSGITEMFLHPSYSLSNSKTIETDEWLKREYELKLLQSGDLLEVAEKEGIILTSWQDAPFNMS